MASFLVRYRVIVGALLFVLVLALSGFLVWKEGRWQPEMEKRLATLENNFSALNDSVLASEENLNAEDLIAQSQAENSTQDSSGVVAGASTSSSSSSASKKSSTSSSSASKSSGSSSSSSSTSTKTTTIPVVNINTAGLTELDLIPEVGPSTAQKIIDYRNTHGGFKSIEEIKNVSNIGDKKFEKMKAYIKVQ